MSLPTLSNPGSPAPAVFIDRDGTLMEDVPYIRDPSKVELFPGIAEALRKLQSAGFRLVMVTNQSGIGRGWNTLDDFNRVQERFFELLGSGLIEAVYMCPDAPNVPSERRKPAPGMVFEATRDLNLDLPRSWFIGDKAADVECGRNAGIPAVQVQTGEGAAQRSEIAAYFAPSFPEAVDFIIAHAGHAAT